MKHNMEISNECYLKIRIMDSNLISSLTLEVRLDVLPEDGHMGTEIFRSIIGIFNILMCVNMF